MQIEFFEGLRDLVITASPYQLMELEDLIHLAESQNPTGMALARRTIQTVRTRCCPHCASNNVVLHGRDENKRQRFKCRGCRRTYNIMTGTPMARARKPEKWGSYLRCMTNHMSVRDIVKTGIGINHVTVWRWRHRFLTAAANNNAAALSGVIEVSETFFPLSFKGSRGCGSTPRQLVAVLTAVDNGGAVFDAILAPTCGIEAALNGRVAAGSVLCSDASPAYVTVAEQAIAEHYVVCQPLTDTDAQPVPTEARRSERLGLSRVNSHHECLKQLIDNQCCGVATKYLANYLGWHRAMIKSGFNGRTLLEIALYLKSRK